MRLGNKFFYCDNWQDYFLSSKPDFKIVNIVQPFLKF